MFREEDGKDRYKVIGVVDGKFWTAVHVRHGNTVRFISVRIRNDGEEKQYLALRPTRATLKIFRSTVRRLHSAPWAGGSGLLHPTALGLTQEGFAEPVRHPAKRDLPVRTPTDHAAPCCACLSDRHRA